MTWIDDDMPPSQALLLAWLGAETDGDRQRVLAANDDLVTAELADDLLELARGGPSYGGDRRNEARFQVDLLELAVAVADQIDAPEALDEAQRLLAAALADLPGGEARRVSVLEASIAASRLAGRWKSAQKAQFDLARLRLALGRGREALADFEAALDFALADADLTDEADETLTALVDLANAAHRPVAAKAPLGRYMAAQRDLGDRLRTGHAANLAGRHWQALGFTEEARPLLQEAAALLGEMGDDGALARAHLQLLAIGFAHGDVVAAARHLEAVLVLKDRLDDPELVAEIDQQFGQFM